MKSRSKVYRRSTYPAFLTVTKSWLLSGLGLGLRLGSLLGGRSLLRFGLLGLFGLGGSGRSILLGLRLLGFGLLRLLGALILLSTFGSAAKLDLDEILADSNGIFLIYEELLDGTRLWGINRNINLITKCVSDITSREGWGQSWCYLPCLFQLSQSPRRARQNRQPLYIRISKRQMFNHG